MINILKLPYYKQLMDARGIAIGDAADLDDISLFHVLTKSDVLRAGRQLVSRRYPWYLRRTAYTGGTTGTPMALQRDFFSIGNEHAFMRRQYDWAGLGLRDTCAVLTGRIVSRGGLGKRVWSYDPFMIAA